MKTLAEAVGELARANCAVLCLDTCVFLDIITTGNRGEADLIGVNRTLLQVLVTTPGRLQLVVTELVAHEWGQRKDEVIKDAQKWLKETDRHIQQVHRAWEELDKPLAHGAAKYFDSALTDDLSALSKALLDQAVVLQEEVACVTRALDRVKQKRRPSHEGQIKDSIHLEHFLELSSQLGSGMSAPITAMTGGHLSVEATAPGRKVIRQEPPLAARADQVEDALNNPT